MKDAEGTRERGVDQKKVAAGDLFYEKNGPFQWFDIKPGQQNLKKGCRFEPLLKPPFEARPTDAFHSSGMSPPAPFDRPGAACRDRSEHGEMD
jgi:hypothetical protein